MIADTPKPPYYAVIFSSLQSGDTQGYAETAGWMQELARKQPGYPGFESAREGLGIAVSYWKDETCLLNWKENVEHLTTQKMGRKKWYARYKVRIAKVERDYSDQESTLEVYNSDCRPGHNKRLINRGYRGIWRSVIQREADCLRPDR